jgi:hypothetical protein
MREQFLRRIGKSITLRWLQETEKYVDAFPEFKAIWEQDKEEIWNLVYRNYNGFPVFTAMEQFSRWVAERNMITAILAVKQTHSRLPREMRNMIAYQTLLADCDVDIPNLSDKEVYPSGLSYPRRMIGENAEPDIFAFSGAELLSGTQWINEQFDKLGVKEQKERSYKQHPLVGKWWPSEEKLIYTPPTLKLYGLAELLGVAEFNIMGGWLNNTVPLWSKARYCKVLKERIGLIAPEPVETILEESRWRAQAEEELQKKQLRERQTRQMVEMDQADEEEKRQQTARRRR